METAEFEFEGIRWTVSYPIEINVMDAWLLTFWDPTQGGRRMNNRSAVDSRTNHPMNGAFPTEATYTLYKKECQNRGIKPRDKGNIYTPLKRLKQKLRNKLHVPLPTKEKVIDVRNRARAEINRQKKESVKATQRKIDQEADEEAGAVMAIKFGVHAYKMSREVKMFSPRKRANELDSSEFSTPLPAKKRRGYRSLKGQGGYYCDYYYY